MYHSVVTLFLPLLLLIHVTSLYATTFLLNSDTVSFVSTVPHMGILAPSSFLPPSFSCPPPNFRFLSWGISSHHHSMTWISCLIIEIFKRISKTVCPVLTDISLPPVSIWNLDRNRVGQGWSFARRGERRGDSLGSLPGQPCGGCTRL